MSKTRDKFSIFGSTCYSRLSGRLHEQCGLLARIALTKVPQELKEPDGPW